MVSDYLQKTSGTCRYSYSKLKDVLYLVSSEHLKDVQIDNGEAYISGLTELPLRINGFNIQLTEETSLDERYKFQKTLTLSMHGYVNYKIFGGRYYAIVESEDGTFFMVNVDFPARITHTFNLSQNTNQTDFTFASLSNFPTLKLNANFEAVSPVCLGLNVYGIDKLELIEKEKARLDTVNRTVVSTDDFKKVEFLGNSCTFQEVYDGNKVTDTITFDIAFDNYKPSWQYNLLEFLDNKYSAIITPKGNDNKYYPGFNFGLEPSYTIQTASQQGQSDVITVSLKETSSYGTTAAIDWDKDQTTETRWRWVKRVGETVCFECIGLGRARYLVKQEVDYFGNPTGNYQVMEGYESQYPVFHIVGTFTTEEIFETSECSDDESCHIESTLPATIIFTATTCNTYSLQTSCDWEFTDVPSHITVSPLSGHANSAYTVTICNSLTPTATVVENNMILKCCKTNRMINIKTQTDSGCIRPQTQYINCLAQDVQFVFDGECRINITSIDPRLTYSIGNNTLTVRVPRNFETSAITWTIIATNCYCSSESTTAYIIQDKTYERWIQQEGFICEDGNSYHIERRYTGTTSDNINVRTNETRKGTLIQSGDTRCASGQKKWEWDGESYYCVNGNKFKAIFEWVSYDGINWVKTGKTTLGDMVEESSEWCNSAVTYSWSATTDWTCEQTEKFRATYSGGDVYYVSCNSDATLTTATTKPTAYPYSAMTTAVIGDCVTSIGENAFEYCSGLTNVTIGSGITSIGQMAFYDCYSLTSINIPSGVTSIGDYSFLGCSGLTSIDIPNSVTSIGGYAFYKCSGITAVTIGSGVTSIGEYAFYECNGLTSITCLATTPPTLGSTVLGGTNNCPIYVPSDSVDAYKNASGWSTYASRIQAIQ